MSNTADSTVDGPDESTTQSCKVTISPQDFTDQATTLTDSWDCPHDQHGNSDKCLFHQTPDERRDAGITDDDVITALVDKLTAGDPAERALIGATLPALPLSHLDVENDTQHPLDLRHATVTGEFTAEQAKFEELIDLRHSHLGGIDAFDATFENGIWLSGVTVTGDVTLLEATIIDGDARFTDTQFDCAANFNEAVFEDDVSFKNAEFSDDTTFCGAEFHGRSADINDQTTFTGVTFDNTVKFDHATFESTVFDDATFNGDASFTHATTSGTLSFERCTFHGEADLREVTFNGDVDFSQTKFSNSALFTGVKFNGGAAVINDDVTFEDAEFHSDATFEEATFGFASFGNATFNGPVLFERARFTEDIAFTGAAFDKKADFDEIVVSGDADFTDTTFKNDAIFRGSEFLGGTNHLKDDVILDGAVFRGAADFHSVTVSSGSFFHTEFYGNANFTDSTFDEITIGAVSLGADTYLNFTDAVLTEGRITQPIDGWVRFDLTQATLGEVELDAVEDSDRRQLLDYFRFCDTNFDGFDFSEHTEYLDRNEWVLHEFDAGDQDGTYTVELTPETIERTYLKAKRNASNQSNIKAAGEFRVKRQQHARSKFSQIARDRTETLQTRARNGLRAAENYFLGITCGYGLRLYRIVVVFLVFPMLAAGLFAFGGPAFETQAGQLTIAEALTGENLRTLALNIYFSYITFLTIGYGNIGPIGLGARGLSAFLVYANVILAGLVLYALIKRSEV